MGIGGTWAQFGGPSSPDAAIKQFLGQLLAYVAFVAFAVWLWMRQRRSRKPRQPVPDWYPDPYGQPVQRWWNGTNWTANVRPYPWPGAWQPPSGPSGEPGVGMPPGYAGDGSAGPWPPDEPLGPGGGDGR